jgi:hypothetical protein
MKKHRGAIIVFFLIYLFVWNIANAQMDSIERNPGNDKRQCESVEECPVIEERVKWKD